MPALAERVSHLSAGRHVGEVVDRLTTIESDLDGFFAPAGGGPVARREHPPLPDGVACFNGMYLQVTEAVRDALPGFESPEFVERLDVVFAEFYFQAFDAAAAHAWVSKAWAPLFKRKDARGVLALQFAIAGMNAHINNDLAHALVLSWRELDHKPAHDSPERRDYERSTGSSSASRPTSRVPSPTTSVRDGKALGTSGRHPRHVEHPRGPRPGVGARADHARDARPQLDSLFDRVVGFAGHQLLRRSILG